MIEVTVIERMLISPDATLFEALEALDGAGKEIVFVCDGERRVLGTVTDGDVRRAILRGLSLRETTAGSVMNGSFTAVDRDAGRAEVLDMMRAREISQVPVIGQDGVIVGLHTLQELVGGGERPNWAVIMAGGRGKRLRPLTDTIPKPMVKVAGRPILERLVLHLVGSGIRRIFLSVNYLNHIVEEHFGDGSGFGCSIEYLREDQPLGTGGCLSLLPERPTEPLLVMNGDLVTQVGIGRMISFHEEGGYAATIGLNQHTVEVPFGVADVEDGALKGLREKPTLRMLVNAGIYVLSPGALDLVPQDTEFPITELFRDCLAEGRPVGAHLLEEEWMDVGVPEELARANGRF